MERILGAGRYAVVVAVVMMITSLEAGDLRERERGGRNGNGKTGSWGWNGKGGEDRGGTGILTFSLGALNEDGIANFIFGSV
jgi:hypothetical protein